MSALSPNLVTHPCPPLLVLSSAPLRGRRQHQRPRPHRPSQRMRLGGRHQRRRRRRAVLRRALVRHAACRSLGHPRPRPSSLGRRRPCRWGDAATPPSQSALREPARLPHPWLGAPKPCPPRRRLVRRAAVRSCQGVWGTSENKTASGPSGPILAVSAAADAAAVRCFSPCWATPPPKVFIVAAGTRACGTVK